MHRGIKVMAICFQGGEGRCWKKLLPCNAGEYNVDRVKQNGGSAEGGKDPTSGWFDQPAQVVDTFVQLFSNILDERYIFLRELSFSG